MKRARVNIKAREVSTQELPATEIKPARHSAKQRAAQGVQVDRVRELYDKLIAKGVLTKEDLPK